jgi:hypothetical protein
LRGLQKVARESSLGKVKFLLELYNHGKGKINSFKAKFSPLPVPDQITLRSCQAAGDKLAGIVFWPPRMTNSSE